MKKIVILISGRGSNMQAVVKSCQDQSWNAKIAAVISNREDALGLQFAQAADIATEVVEHQKFAGREDFEKALQAKVDAYQPDLVLLAGFMRVLTEQFVLAYEGRLINLHPALLPSFRGLRTCERALAEGVAIHGSTVHFVVPELDSGPIIAQVAVPVLLTDDVQALEQRVLSAEHQLLPRVVRWFVEDKVKLLDQRAVFIKNEPRWLFLDIE